MTKPNFQRAISLTEEENTRVNELQKKGVKVIDIFRKGIEVLERGEK